MGTQAARVALWVPTTAPPQVGDAVTTTGAQSGAQGPIPTTFQLAGGGSFATPAEITTGTVTGKGVDPSGLRGEINRLFANALDLATTILTTVTLAPNKVVKTGTDGLIDASLIPAGSSTLPAVIDAGTF